MTTKERKIKPPDDPTQMVAGRPKISINANKLQINEFLKRNKKSLNPSIQRSSGGKQKSLDVLRKELEEGGHFVGVKDTTNTSSRGAKTSKANVEKQEKEDQYKQLITANPQGFNVKNINTISLMGFTKETFVTPAPSQDEIAMSGFGGMPVPDELQEKVKTKLPGITEMRDYLSTQTPNVNFANLSKKDMFEMYLSYKGDKDKYLDVIKDRKIGVQEIRDYLATRIPTENFKGLPKKELREIYDLEKAKDFIEDDTDSDEEEPITLSEQKSIDLSLENDGERVFPDDGERDYNGDLFRKFYYVGETYFMKGDYEIYEDGGLGDDPIGVWDDDEGDILDLEDAYRTMGDAEITQDGVRYEDFVLHPRFGDDRTYWSASIPGEKYDRKGTEKIYDSPGGRQIATLTQSTSDFLESPLKFIDPTELTQEEEFPDGGGWGTWEGGTEEEDNATVYSDDSVDEDDLVDEGKFKLVPTSFEGVDYLEGGDFGDLYNQSFEHVGDWNEDLDEIRWTHQKYERQHQAEIRYNKRLADPDTWGASGIRKDAKISKRARKMLEMD